MSQRFSQPACRAASSSGAPTGSISRSNPSIAALCFCNAVPEPTPPPCGTTRGRRSRFLLRPRSQHVVGCAMLQAREARQLGKNRARPLTKEQVVVRMIDGYVCRRPSLPWEVVHRWTQRRALRLRQTATDIQPVRSGRHVSPCSPTRRALRSPQVTIADLRAHRSRGPVTALADPRPSHFSC